MITGTFKAEYITDVPGYKLYPTGRGGLQNTDRQRDTARRAWLAKCKKMQRLIDKHEKSKRHTVHTERFTCPEGYTWTRIEIKRVES